MREPLDDGLTDMGRALASSLLDDLTVERPTQVVRRNRTRRFSEPAPEAESAPESLAPSEPAAASLDASDDEFAGLSRRERRLLREQREREATEAAAAAETAEATELAAAAEPASPAPAFEAPTPGLRAARRAARAAAADPTSGSAAPMPTAEPAVAEKSVAEPAVAEEPVAEPAVAEEPVAEPAADVERVDRTLSTGDAQAPAAPDGSMFQVARPRQAPGIDVPIVDAEPEPEPQREPQPDAAPAPARTEGPAVPMRTAEPAVREEAPAAAPATAPEAEARPVVRQRQRDRQRDRLRHLTPDPYAALPWPEDETADLSHLRLAPEQRPGSRIRDLDLTVARAASPDDDNDDTPEPERTLTRSLVEWVMVLGSAAIVALLLQHFVVQFFEIPSESMYPTLKDGDTVLVSKLAYAIGGGVERGDVIVFKRPASERTDDPEQPAQLIKRVIGLPGDVVEARGGVVYINGDPLEESGEGRYLDPSVVTNNLGQPVTVPRGEYFVMGDNRERSHDSRYFGAIPESDIIGRAVVIAWPFSRWEGL